MTVQIEAVLREHFFAPVVASALAMSSGSASAAVLVSFVENARGVFGTLSGELDTYGVEQFGASVRTDEAYIDPSVNTIVMGPVGGETYFIYSSRPEPSWGQGGITTATYSSGSTFTYHGGGFHLPCCDDELSPLSGDIAFIGSTFANLGVNPVTYVTTLPRDTITVSFAQVPLPAPLPLLGVGLLIAASPSVWRRRRNGVVPGGQR